MFLLSHLEMTVSVYQLKISQWLVWLATQVAACSWLEGAGMDLKRGDGRASEAEEAAALGHLALRPALKHRCHGRGSSHRWCHSQTLPAPSASILLSHVLGH